MATAATLKRLKVERAHHMRLFKKAEAEIKKLNRQIAKVTKEIEHRRRIRV